MNLNSRLSRLCQSLAEKGLDGVFISQPENWYYLSGFDGSAGYLLITPQHRILATDFRYLEQAGSQAPDYEIFPISNDLAEWLPRLTADLGLKKLGFEAGHISFAFYRELTDVLKPSPLKLVPLSGLVETMRAVKEPEEIELITEAAGIADSACAHAEEIIRLGISEQELAWEIEKFMREQGSQALPFDIIVASGPNSALPHTKPSPRPINPGEPVVIDIGARVSGYSSDLSRTLCLGKPDDNFNKVYTAVLGAQLAILAIMKEGMSGEEADAIARTVIEQAGYGPAFGHGLGHGVGLAPHELPRLGKGATEPLLPGMVFTLEPGIYLSGWGGVRIEDMVVMTKDKVNVISKARKVMT